LKNSETPEAPHWYISWSSNQTKPSSISSKEDPILGGIPETIIKNISIDGVTGEIKELRNSDFIDN